MPLIDTANAISRKMLRIVFDRSQRDVVVTQIRLVERALQRLPRWLPVEIVLPFFGDPLVGISATDDVSESRERRIGARGEQAFCDSRVSDAIHETTHDVDAYILEHSAFAEIGQWMLREWQGGVNTALRG